MAKFKFAGTTHDCGDETYIALLYHVAQCQARRLRLADPEDAIQSAAAHFAAVTDLRTRYRDDMGTKFTTFVTTCVFRHLCPIKLAAFRTFDPERYVDQHDEYVREPLSTELVDALRVKHGNFKVDVVLAYVAGTPIPGYDMFSLALRKSIARTFLQEMIDEPPTP